MTAPTVVDPWVDVPIGTRINNDDEFPGYNDGITGVWTRSNYTWCGQLGPQTGKACTRPSGHSDQIAHTACSDENGYSAILHERWGAVVPDPAQIVISTDPHNDVAVGDVVEISDADDAVIHTADTGLWCCAVNPDGSVGMCSRKAGHDLAWAHMSGTLYDVPCNLVNRWGGPQVVAPDVWEDVRLERGTWIRDLAGWDDRQTGLRVAAEYRCGVYGEMYSRDYPCTRRAGHNGRHLYSDRDQIIWVEPARAPEPVSAGSDAMPPDGSPVDSADTVLSAAPQVGDVVKLRDRARRLYVIAARRATAEIDVLDLTSSELWSMPISRAVKLPEEGDEGTTDVPSVAELEVVGKWYHDHRDEVRKVAVREYRGGRWCMAGLNEQLAELGLPTYEPRLVGKISIQVSFEHPDTSVGRTTIERLVREALADPMVTANLITAMPQIEGIELDTSDLTIVAHDLSRQ